MECIPNEIRDRIAECVAEVAFHRYQYHPLDDNIHDDPTFRKTLLSLRLVDRTFSESASIPLFRSIKANNSPQHQGNFWGPARLILLAHSRHARKIERLSICLGSQYDNEKVHRYVHAMREVLTTCLAAFRNLSWLEISGPVYPVGAEPAPEFSDSLRECYWRMVLDALCFAPMPKLRELKLSLPVISDFVLIYRSAQALAWPEVFDDFKQGLSVLKQLQHLDIRICDNTGPGGQRRWSTPISQGWTQPKLDNGIRDFFRFIQEAGSLASLRITSTHILGTRMLGLHDLHSLEVIQLVRVGCNYAKLGAIVGQNKATLRHVELAMVELWNRTWEDALSLFWALPMLECFRVEYCGYAAHRGSPSALYRPRRLAIGAVKIESLRARDLPALEHLQHLVNLNRAVLSQPDDDGVSERVRADWLVRAETFWQGR